MFNTVYNYNSREYENFEFQDYTSIYFGDLEKTIKDYPQYFEFIEVSDDDKIENISYQRYGSENYADLILACNTENFLWSTPYNQDVMLDYLDSIMNMINVSLNIEVKSDDISQDYLDLKESIHNNIENENSQKRKFRVPKVEYISNVINIINNYKSQHIDTQWILGSE